MNLPKIGRGAGGDHRLEQDHLPALRAHRLRDVLQDRRRARIVPVVNDVLHDVRVAAFGHRREEIAGHGLAAVRQPCARDARLRAVDDMADVGEHAAHVGVLLQDRHQHLAVPAGHVHEQADPAEVVGLERRADHRRAEGRHRFVEHPGVVRVLRQIFEHRHAERRVRRGLARHDRIHQARVNLEMDGVGQKGGDAAQRTGHVLAKELSRRIQREPPRARFGKDANAHEQAEDAEERIFVRARGASQLGDVLRAGSEMIGDVQRDRNVERRRGHVSDGDLKNRKSGIGIWCHRRH